MLDIILIGVSNFCLGRIGRGGNECGFGKHFLLGKMEGQKEKS